MYTADDLKNIVHDNSYSQKELILIALGCDGGLPKTAKELVELLVMEGGLRSAQKIPVSSRFSGQPIWAVRRDNRWELNNAGIEKLRELGLHTKSVISSTVVSNLTTQLKQISDEQTREFVDEALQCYRRELYRAAVVLSWVGAMHCLFVYVHKTCLKDFNDAARKRFDNPPASVWKNVKTVEGFTNMKEANFLMVLEDIQLIGKTVKKKLHHQLDLRNGCGHPNGLVVGEYEVAGHLETLIGNVFKKFSA